MMALTKYMYESTILKITFEMLVRDLKTAKKLNARLHIRCSLNKILQSISSHSKNSLKNQESWGLFKKKNASDKRMSCYRASVQEILMPLPEPCNTILSITNFVTNIMNIIVGSTPFPYVFILLASHSMTAVISYSTPWNPEHNEELESKCNDRENLTLAKRSEIDGVC